MYPKPRFKVRCITSIEEAQLATPEFRKGMKLVLLKKEKIV